MKTDSVILGWCSYQKGGRITNVSPDGFESHGEGDGWDEEQWCYWRVEGALGKYSESYAKLKRGYEFRACKQMRSWLKDVFWESEPMSSFGDWESMVHMEILRFKKLVDEEIKQNPKPIKLPA
jgi:hypothetical protein